MTVQTVEHKRMTLKRLKLGDKVLLTNGKTYEYVTTNRTKFIGKRDGMQYNIPIAMFKEVVEKVEREYFDVHSLTEGELFYYLNKKSEPILVRFKYMINTDKIMAENPITQGGITIPSSMVHGTVNELIKR